ncbi:MAG: hypothetical protein NVS2B17_28460 [Candidatus Velthaea sp.]
MDNERGSGTIAVLAFAGSLTSWVGLLVAVLNGDAMLASVSLAGAAYCGGTWAWNVGLPIELPHR